MIPRDRKRVIGLKSVYIQPIGVVQRVTRAWHCASDRERVVLDRRRRS